VVGRCVNATQGSALGQRYTDSVTFQRFAPVLAACLAATSAGGCSSCASYRRCSPPEPARLHALPERLSGLGLFVSADGAPPKDGVLTYEPAFTLWSDGATKRRWIELPAAAHVDTSDADDWRFPVGTRFYKEFAREGRRLETRVLTKWGSGDADWSGAAYIWLDDQSDAIIAPDGARDVDASGYDVPSAAECGACHGGRRSHVLGFSALQLGAHADGLRSLRDLEAAGVLSTRLDVSAIPDGDPEWAALGYLHANCGHCHNARRPVRTGPRCYDPERTLDLSLPLAALDGARMAPAYATAVPEWVTPGEPEHSRLFQLVARRGARLHMPPLATERVDEEGVALIRAWIEGLAGSTPQ
jgi:hypothetical protein